MAGPRPFKLHDAPDGRPAPVADRPRFNPAKTNEHAREEGETLVEAGQENMQPDFELDSSVPEEAGQPHGEGHVQRPAYKAANPWPASKPVAHKPFKV
jgi:hypothetical protein